MPQPHNQLSYRDTQNARGVSAFTATASWEHQSHSFIFGLGILAENTSFFPFPPKVSSTHPPLNENGKENKIVTYLVSLIVFLNSLVIGALKPPFLSKESIVWIWSQSEEKRGHIEVSTQSNKSVTCSNMASVEDKHVQEAANLLEQRKPWALAHILRAPYASLVVHWRLWHRTAIIVVPTHPASESFLSECPSVTIKEQT